MEPRHMNELVNLIEKKAVDRYVEEYDVDKHTLGHNAFLISEKITSVVIVGPAELKHRVSPDGSTFMVFLEA